MRFFVFLLFLLPVGLPFFVIGFAYEVFSWGFQFGQHLAVKFLQWWADR